eukprot:scaffold149_cov179-Amphora_coffeaeformis.AAC.10
MTPPVLQKDHDSFQASEHNENSEESIFIINDGLAPLPPAARYVPRCLRYDHGAPMEATGIAVDKWAMGPVFMSSMFLGPALLQLATEAAGCVYNETEETICENKVYGFRPSSLLSNMAVASGLLVPITLPLVGALVDHTPYRKQVAAWTAMGVAVVKGVEVSVGPSTWFFITILQITTSVFYNVHVTTTLAYNSELSSKPEVQAKYNSVFSMISFTSMLAFLVAVLVLSGALGTDDVRTARLSQTITALTALVTFSFAWKYLFRDRPASSVIQPGQTLVTSGFYKVWESSNRIARHYKPLFWVICSLMFAEAAMSGLTTIATTFLSVVLKMNASEIGLTFLVVLVAGIPGSWLGGWTTVQLKSPIKSAILCNVLFVLVTGCAAFMLRNSEHKRLAYMFGLLWGTCIGWLSPVDTTMFISVMPKDSRAEFMGIYMLAVSILAWLPPLVFTTLNEVGMDMAWGLVSLDIYFMLAVVFLCLVGDYHKAVEDVAEEMLEMTPETITHVPTDKKYELY